METTGVSDLPSLPGVPGGTAIWHGVWMAPSSPVGWPVSFILCAYFCLQVPAAWPTVEGQREAPAGSVGKHVVTMSCRPQLKERGKQRVPCVHNLCSFPLDLDLLGLPRDPRNPLPESPSWTLTGIRCSVLGGFLKPGTCSVLIPALSTPSSWANTPPTPPQLHTLGKSSAGKESSSHKSRVSHAGHPVPFPHTRRGLGVMHCPQEESQASSVRRPTPVSPPAPDSIS